MKSATRVLISTFGGFVGLIGMEHGLGEILQGNRAPAGLMIQSWPDSDFFRILGGEPAMTILPNLLITGILAILVSLVYLAWATILVEHKLAGRALVLLCVPMLLFGGGIFPPVLGLLIGAAAGRLYAPLTWWQTHLSAGGRSFLGVLWPWLYSACLLAWLGMFPGVAVLSYYFGVENDALILALLVCMFGFLCLAGVSGLARDSQRQIGLYAGI